MSGFALDANVAALASAFGQDQGAQDDAIADAQSLAGQADAKAVAAQAVQALRDFATFHLVDYLHPDDLAAARQGDVMAQDENRVTAAIRQMHFEALTFWSSGANRSASIEWGRGGVFAINDEIFDEASAQIIWDKPNDKSLLRFDFGATELRIKNWLALARVRTSGYWANKGITYPVPTVVLRWEQGAGSPHSPLTEGYLMIRGGGFMTDPVGVKTYRTSKMSFGNISVRLRNHMFFIEGAYNGRFPAIDCNYGGFQPTEFGGTTGHLPSGVTFSSSGAVITASEPVFTAGHVGKSFGLSRAGAQDHLNARLAHWATIASYQSPTQVTLAEVPAIDVTGVAGTFDAIRGTFEAGNPVVTLSASISSSLAGRFVTLSKTRAAGHNDTRGTLTTIIIAHTGNQITLADAPAVAGTDQLVVFSPMVLIDTLATTDAAIQSDDISLPDLRAESSEWHTNACIPLVIGGGSSMRILDTKLHGCADSVNNWGGTACAALFGYCDGLTMLGEYQQTGQSPKWGSFMFVGGAINVRIMGRHSPYAYGNKAAIIYVDPVLPVGDSRVNIVADFIHVSAQFPQPGQAALRLGPNGQASMVAAGGSVDSHRPIGVSLFPHRFGDVQADKITGTAVTQSMYDTAPGRLLKVQDFGMSGDVSPPIAVDLHTLPAVHGRWRASGTTANRPDASSYVVDQVLNTTGTRILIARSIGTSYVKTATCRYDGSNWSAWVFEQTARGGVTAGRPSSPFLWEQWNNTTTGKLERWNGSAWVDATGAAV